MDQSFIMHRFTTMFMISKHLQLQVATCKNVIKMTAIH